MGDAGLQASRAIRLIRDGQHNRRYDKQEEQDGGAAEDDPPGIVTGVWPRPVPSPPAWSWLHGGILGPVQSGTFWPGGARLPTDQMLSPIHAR